jgi:phosphoenolpyruvate carboxykinase (ATP)
MQTVGMPGEYSLEHHGLHNLRTAYWNLTPAALVEQIILREEAVVSQTGAIVVNTRKHTGRSPNDKYIVKKYPLDNEIWWGKNNQPIAPEKFSLIHSKMRSYLQGNDIFIQDLQAGAHPDYHVPIRVISENAWAALFAFDLFIRLPPERIVHHEPLLTILHCPNFQTNPQEDGTNSGTFIGINLAQNLILIAGTSYAGEIKKSVFTALNFMLPHKLVLPMHCSANINRDENVALFFGLSGTGKTTLSSDPERRLIGDDEHGWSEKGVFNFEGGCYAKMIHLRPDLEPLIWNAAQRFGSVLENVTCDPYTRALDFDDDHRTENTRGAYPIYYIPNHVPSGLGGHPKTIFFLSADAFGILPPIAKLDRDQAMYYFLSGYTSKLAGTETGLGAEPQATFSTCFGAPFMPMHPKVYAEMLGKKIADQKVQVWLINTGWIGGPYGIGQRIRLSYSRAMIRAALTGALNNVAYRKDPFFGLSIPETCPEIPSGILNPISTWQDSQAYAAQAEMLIIQFQRNFEQFRQVVPDSVVNAGPPVRTKSPV